MPRFVPGLGELFAGGGVELAQQFADVPLRARQADAEEVGDLGVRMAAADEAPDFALAGSERFAWE